MSLDVLVVQHGEKERLPGDPGLTELGRAQAEATARWLGNQAAADGLWSSPMRRAAETAAPIAARLGLEPATDPRFRDRMNWEGEDRQSLADFLSDWQTATQDRTYAPRSGDSSLDAGDRFLAGLHALADRTPHGTIIVVAHGGVTVDALRTILGDAAIRSQKPDLIEDGVPCCAITHLRHEDGRVIVVDLPRTDHLDAGTSDRPHRPA